MESAFGDTGDIAFELPILSDADLEETLALVGECADKDIAVVDSMVMRDLKDTLMGGEFSTPQDEETTVEMEHDAQKNRKRKKARVLDSEGIRRRNLAQQQRVKEQRKAADELRAEVSKALTRVGQPVGNVSSMSRTVLMKRAADLLSRLNLHEEGCLPGETRIQRQAHPIETFNWNELILRSAMPQAAAMLTGEILGFNHAFERYFAYSPEQLRGKGRLTMFHMTMPEELPAFFASVSRAMSLCNNGTAKQEEGGGRSACSDITLENSVRYIQTEKTCIAADGRHLKVRLLMHCVTMADGKENLHCIVVPSQ